MTQTDDKTQIILDNIKKITVIYQQILLVLINKTQNISLDPLLLNALSKNSQIYAELMASFAKNPMKLLTMQTSFANKFLNLVDGMIKDWQTCSTDNTSINSYQPDKRDKRFNNTAWQENIFFNFIKQYYLMTTTHLAEHLVLEGAEHEHTNHYIRFMVKQLTDALAPTNFAYLNPVVLKQTLDSNFSNIVDGLTNLLNDINKSHYNLTTSTDNFKLGINIATTTGKIIAQNELMQLICYKPLEQTKAIPLLIVPPWINKYYILDLSPENSLVQWLVQQNYQVFLISWINPAATEASKSFENYISEGSLFAINYIIKHYKYQNINTLGYCIGGTLLASTLAYMIQQENHTVKSATFLTSLFDFSHTGDFSLFTNLDNIEAFDQMSQAKGYFESRYLSSAFSMMRANDMIWSFVINNYLLGKQIIDIDLLYWNADATNLPSLMSDFYLRNMYLNNLLSKPNALTLLNQPIDLSVINIPTFFLSTLEDHIAPWQTTYKSAQLLTSPVEFCLSASGHVAGVINPPHKQKYSYRINNKLYDTAQEWQATATEIDGSWWPYWLKWLDSQSASLTTSIKYDDIYYIEQAPGSYVKVRCS